MSPVGSSTSRSVAALGAGIDRMMGTRRESTEFPVALWLTHRVMTQIEFIVRMAALKRRRDIHGAACSRRTHACEPTRAINVLLLAPARDLLRARMNRDLVSARHALSDELGRIEPAILVRALKARVARRLRGVAEGRESAPLAGRAFDELASLAQLLEGSFASTKDSRAMLEAFLSERLASEDDDGPWRDVTDFLLARFEEQQQQLAALWRERSASDARFVGWVGGDDGEASFANVAALLEVLSPPDVQGEDETWAGYVSNALRESEAAAREAASHRADRVRAADPKATWSARRAAFADTPRPYRPAEAFAEGEAIAHLKFGVGFVLAATDKIIVLFESGEKTLVHTRQS